MLQFKGKGLPVTCRKGKGKGLPVTCRKGKEDEQNYCSSYINFATSHLLRALTVE